MLLYNLASIALEDEFVFPYSTRNLSGTGSSAFLHAFSDVCMRARGPVLNLACVDE